MLAQRSWSTKKWLALFLLHPLLNRLASRLVFVTTTASEPTTRYQLDPTHIALAPGRNHRLLLHSVSSEADGRCDYFTLAPASVVAVTMESGAPRKLRQEVIAARLHESGCFECVWLHLFCCREIDSAVYFQVLRFRGSHTGHTRRHRGCGTHGLHAAAGDGSASSSRASLLTCKSLSLGDSRVDQLHE